MSIYIYILFSSRYFSIYIYIFIYAVELKIRPKIALFWVENLSKVSFFLVFVFFFKHLLLSAGRMRFFKRSKKKDTFFRWKSVQLCCATYLDGLSTQPWTDFQLNNFVNFWPFSILKKCRNHYFYSAFSQTMKFLSPSQKIKEHYLWTQLR